jgi:NitT/TauT family transport system permease protein
MTTTAAEPVAGATAAGVGTAASRGRAPRRGRGRKQHALFRLRGDIPFSMRIGLGVLGVAAVFALWWVAATAWSGGSFLVPTPPETWDAGLELYRSGTLWTDFKASAERILWGYSISMGVGVVVGVGIGCFRSVEAVSEASIGFLRYIPATALTPLFLIWLGIDEAPKVALIVVGTVFFNILMTADVVRAVPVDMISSAYTLGAGRLRVLRKVVLPHAWPGIVDVARINLAAAWLMLVVAELSAGAQEGLGFRLARAQRFYQVDTMFAILIVFGVIGVTTDLGLRWLRNVTAKWARP